MGRMIETPFIAHSELTNEIYIVAGKEKYRVTEQAIKAVMAIKALEQESTTKNDLGVDTNKLLADCEKMSFDIEIFNKPLKVVALDAVKNIAKDLINSENPNKSEILTGSTTKNDLSSGLEKNSKKLEKDLGLDCISRVQTQTEIEMNASRYTIAKERGGMGQVEWSDQLIKVSDAVDIIRHLPSVTPQEPRKGHWIWELDEIPSTPISPYELNYAGWVCSCCHEFPDDICEWDNPDEPPTYKFCPNCGSYNGGASNGNE